MLTYAVVCGRRALRGRSTEVLAGGRGPSALDIAGVCGLILEEEDLLDPHHIGPSAQFFNDFFFLNPHRALSPAYSARLVARGTAYYYIYVLILCVLIFCVHVLLNM